MSWEQKYLKYKKKYVGLNNINQTGGRFQFKVENDYITYINKSDDLLLLLINQVYTITENKPRSLALNYRIISYIDSNNISVKLISETTDYPPTPYSYDKIKNSSVVFNKSLSILTEQQKIYYDKLSFQKDQLYKTKRALNDSHIKLQSTQDLTKIEKEGLNAMITQQERIILTLEEELDSMNETHQNEIAHIEEEKAAEIAHIEEERAAEIDRIEEETADKIYRIKEENIGDTKLQIESVKQEERKRLNSIIEKFTNVNKKLHSNIAKNKVKSFVFGLSKGNKGFKIDKSDQKLISLSGNIKLPFSMHDNIYVSKIPDDELF